MENILEIKNLSFSYDYLPIIDNVSFNVQRGDFIALAGPNGAGKTTLVKLMLFLEEAQKGKIKIFGEKEKDKIPWDKIGYLAQRNNLFNPLFPAKVKEVIGLGLFSKKRISNKNNQEKINHILDLLDIKDLKNKTINELSGGQQQKVFLGRALISDPELLIMDEPSTALDPKTKNNFFKLIKRLNKEKRVTIIMITHDTAQAGEYAEKLLYLEKKIIFFGKFSDFCKSPEMEKYFGHFTQHLICHQH